MLVAGAGTGVDKALEIVNQMSHPFCIEDACLSVESSLKGIIRTICPWLCCLLDPHSIRLLCCIYNTHSVCFRRLGLESFATRQIRLIASVSSVEVIVAFEYAIVAYLPFFVPLHLFVHSFFLPSLRLHFPCFFHHSYCLEDAHKLHAGKHLLPFVCKFALLGFASIFRILFSLNIFWFSLLTHTWGQWQLWKMYTEFIPVSWQLSSLCLAEKTWCAANKGRMWLSFRSNTSFSCLAGVFFFAHFWGSVNTLR